jgi:hypothetical protein
MFCIILTEASRGQHWNDKNTTTMKNKIEGNGNGEQLVIFIKISIAIGY